MDTSPALRAMLALTLAGMTVARLHAQAPGPEACAALSRIALPATTVTSATYAESGAAGGGRGAVLPALPAHCVVRGSIAPRTGADGKPYETRFELRLPTAWTGRFFYQGGGGNDGTVSPA